MCYGYDTHQHNNQTCTLGSTRPTLSDAILEWCFRRFLGTKGDGCTVCGKSGGPVSTVRPRRAGAQPTRPSRKRTAAEHPTLKTFRLPINNDPVNRPLASITNSIQLGTTLAPTRSWSNTTLK